MSSYAFLQSRSFVLFLQLHCFRFVASDVFLHICLFNIGLFRFVSSDSFVQICFFRFVGSDTSLYIIVSWDAFLQICFSKFVCSISYLQIRCLSSVAADSFVQIRFFRFVCSTLICSGSVLQICFFRWFASSDDSFLQVFLFRIVLLHLSLQMHFLSVRHFQLLWMSVPLHLWICHLASLWFKRWPAYEGCHGEPQVPAM
jgi:hypothetical protein